MSVDAAADGDHERSAVLLIRIWRIGGHAGGFRARLLRMEEDDPAGSPFGATADPHEVNRMVRRWLDEFLEH